MDGLWRQPPRRSARRSLASGRPAADIAAVAATAHGDGLYLLDATAGRSGRRSCRSTAAPGHRRRLGGGRRRRRSARADRPGAARLRALGAARLDQRSNEPDRYARIATVVACKDWLRFCLTGTIGTDRTEASTSFTDVRTPGLFAPRRWRSSGWTSSFARPAADRPAPAEIVGVVTPEAAALTGLAAGTPVACGLHDVTASALGIGGHAEGVLAIVAGTYSINEVVSSEPRIDPRWFCRNAIDAGPLEQHGDLAGLGRQLRLVPRHVLPPRAGHGGERRTARSTHCSPPRSTRRWRSRRRVLFHPYLFGSPHGAVASASFPRPARLARSRRLCCAPFSKASPSTTASMSTPCATASPSARHV